MDPFSIFVLVLVGLAGGFLAGLVGVGGGIIYGPALFYFFRASGIEDPILTPLTLGSSLLCVGATAFSGAWAQRGAQTIVWRVAGISGLAAAASVVLTGRFITTQPWYDATLFQLVLGTVLVYVVLRLFIRKQRLDDEALVANRDTMRDGWPLLVVLGAGAGVLVAAAGVGGGVVFVPLYANAVRMPLKAASATSLGSILIVSTAGVLTYLVLGLGSAVPPGAIGYVDVTRSLLLVVPAILTARFGVWTAHRVATKWVRYTFAALAAGVAIQLFWDAFVR